MSKDTSDSLEATQPSLEKGVDPLPVVPSSLQSDHALSSNSAEVIPNDCLSKDTSDSLEAIQPSLEEGVDSLPAVPSSLQSDHADNSALSITHPTDLGFDQPNLLGALESQPDLGFDQPNLLGALESQPLSFIEKPLIFGVAPVRVISKADIDQHIAISQTLTDLKRLINKEKKVAETIQSINTALLVDTVKDKIIRAWGGTIPLESITALQVIEALQSALALEKSYQLGIADRPAHDLNLLRRLVVKALDSLAATVYQECAEVDSAKALLDQAIQNLELSYDLLFQGPKSYFRLYEIAYIGCSIQQSLAGHTVPLKEAQAVVLQLEKMEADQLQLIIDLKKQISKVQEVLLDIQKDIVVIGNLLAAVQRRIDASNLKSSLKLGLVKERVIIADLAVEEEDIRDIICRMDYNKINRNKIDKTLADTLAVKEQIQAAVLSLTVSFIDQAEQLKALIIESDPLCDKEDTF